MLSVQTYDRREQECADELPNRVVEMVNPVVFASEGYPMRVRHEKVLWRYVDVMHETRFAMDFAGLHDNGLTAPEFTWLKNAATITCEHTRAAFGRPLTVRGSLLRALHVFRSITDITGARPLRVFEAGPGSGPLGCLFIQRGWGYAATDITQAFYLHQSHLWDRACGGKLIELADPATQWDGQIEPGQPVHIPWWEFFRMLDRPIPQVDVVTSNHALAEMHPNSLAFTLRLAREMMRTGGGPKLFIFEGWGWEKLQTRDKVFEAFNKAGFSLVHTDDQVTVFAPRDVLTDPGSSILPDGLIQPLVQIGNTIQLPGNTLSNRIVDARTRRKAQLSVRLPQVETFYRELLGSDDLRTADERFLEHIGRNYQ